jgi:hypothetical protein
VIAITWSGESTGILSLRYQWIPFWMVKLEVSRPLAATTNSGVVANSEDVSGLAANHYGVLQKNLEYMFGGAKELKVMFFQCDWFDPGNKTTVDDFGMVEVKHKSHYSDNNLLFAHQAKQVYYLSYPHERIKNWWVVYKVNPEMHTHRYDEYVEIHEDVDVIDFYQEENEGYQSFMVSDRAGLTELATPGIELIEEEPCNTFSNQNMSLKDKKGVNDLMHVSPKHIQMLMTFNK